MNTLPIVKGDLGIDSRGRIVFRTGQDKAAQDVEETLATNARLKEIMGQAYGKDDSFLAFVQDRVDDALNTILAHQSAWEELLSPGEQILAITNRTIKRLDETTVLVYFNVVTDKGTITQEVKFTTGGLL